MKPSFLNSKEPILTVMVQARDPMRTKELIDLSMPCGAEAYGMQFCNIKAEYRNKETYRELFSLANGKPVYVTNYRGKENEGKSDETLASELLELAECGATLIDVTADTFDKTPGEFSENPDAVKRQKELVGKIHEVGAEVLMSSHVLKYIPKEEILKIALGHKERGADISKIVVYANSREEEIEILAAAELLRDKLGIPFLLLAGGECRILRRIGIALGCCTALCVYEHDDLSTQSQPLLSDMVAVKKIFCKK